MATELATANSASSDVGSDSAELSTDINNPANLNFDEPEEEQANEEVAESGTDDNRDAAEGESQEVADPDEPETTEEAAAKEAPDDTVVVALPGGDKVALSELKSGYMRDKDYRHKTQEIGNKRRELETLTSRVTDSVNAIAELLIAQAPKMPDPSLAMTNPGLYVQEKAIHEAAMAQINAVVEKATAPKEVANKLTAEQRSDYLQSENAKLAEAFPQTAKPETRKKFFDDAMSAAGELGYSAEEIQGATDHRLFKLAHYARLGLAAEQAKAKAARKVADVPPMAPNKRQPPNGSKARANQDAMTRLAKTGSMSDALAIDFE